eukprot:756953-Hanusia_phi.AAC.1
MQGKTGKASSCCVTTTTGRRVSRHAFEVYDCDCSVSKLNSIAAIDHVQAYALVLSDLLQERFSSSLAQTSPSNTRDPEFIRKNWIGLEDILKDPESAIQHQETGDSNVQQRNKEAKMEQFRRGGSSASNLQAPFEFLPSYEEERLIEREKTDRLKQALSSCESFLCDLVASLDLCKKEGAEMSRRILEGEDSRRETLSSVRMQNSRLLGALRDAMSEKDNLEEQVRGKEHKSWVSRSDVCPCLSSERQVRSRCSGEGGECSEDGKLAV